MLQRLTVIFKKNIDGYFSRKCISYFFIIFQCSLYSFNAFAKSANADKELYTVTAQFHALAPNAGGQEAYRAELYHNYQAFSIFNDKTLLVGEATLFGLGYSYRLPICDSSCFWQFFTQIGGGLSNAGAFGEITWGTIIPLLPIWLPFSAPKYLPALRVDITSQFYGSNTRLITWSYPIWAGISISF